MGARPYWTKDNIVVAFKAFGRQPSQADCMAFGELPHPCSVIRVFGSWQAGLEAAGMTPRKRGRPRKAAA